MPNYRLLLGTLLLLAPSYASTAAADCLPIPAYATPAPVVACETSSSYTFEVTGNKHQYDKETFRQELRAALAGWFHSVGVEAPAEGTIEFWLAVPDGSPESTQARAVLHWDGGDLVAYIGIGPESWSNLGSQNIGVLAEGESYPKQFGSQAEALLVKPLKTVATADLNTFMAEHGATAPQAVGADWLLYRVEALREAATAQRLKGDPNTGNFLIQTEPDALMEWIGTRQRVFAFSFATP